MTTGLNIILGTSLIIVIILLLRKLLGDKCNPNIRYFLWIFVAIRILIPLEIGLEVPESVLQTDLLPVGNVYENVASGAEEENRSNISFDRPDTGNVNADGVHMDAPNIENIHNNDAYSEGSAGSVLNENGDNVAAAPKAVRISGELRTSVKQAAIFVWLAGCVLLAGYIAAQNLYTFTRIKKQKIMRLENKVDVYQADGYNCLVGIIKPRIYVSEQVLQDEEKCKYVLKHELQHYKAGDNYWLLLRTICLVLQWFNPLVWIAYYKCQEDCELACDYRVTKSLNEQEREEYARTLLHVLRLDVRKNAVFMTAAGNNKRIMRNRLENIFKGNNWKWAAGIGALVVVLLVGGCTFISLQEGTETADMNSDIPRDITGEAEESAQTDSVQQSQSGEKETGVQQGKSQNAIYVDLNLDGFREEIRAEVYVENDIKYHIVKVRNQADEEAEAVFKVRNQELGDHVLLQAAPLNQINNLIVSITDGSSNYGSTDIHVLHMENNVQGITLVEDMTLLDGYETSPAYEEYLGTVLWMDMPLISTGGELLTHNDGRNILKVEALTTQGDTCRYIYWENGEWAYAEEYSFLAQWDVIAGQKELWLTFMDYADDQQKYTVTDMDENGRLEIIVSSMGGTGIYSYSQFYEVNETFDGLTECTTDFVEGSSQPDFISATDGSVQVFRDAKGKLHYIFTDWMRNGAAEYCNVYYDVSLENGHVTCDMLAAMHGSGDSEGNMTVTYTNASGEEISEEEYYSAVDNAFVGNAECVGIFDWRDLGEIADADAAEIYTKLSGISSGIVRGNTFMEAELQPWMGRFGEEFYGNEYYIKAINELRNNRRLPHGLAAYVGEGESFGNRAAFQDIDLDGKKELLLNIGGTCMADMGIYVFQLDESIEEEYKFRSELALWPSVDFYTNGLVRADASHNHGYSDVMDFWPYQLYQYDADTDTYQEVWDVDAWEKRIREEDYDGVPFPDDIDVDGDGMVYRITNSETEELTMMDTADYQAWCSELLEDAEEIKIFWEEIPE